MKLPNFDPSYAAKGLFIFLAALSFLGYQNFLSENSAVSVSTTACPVASLLPGFSVYNGSQESPPGAQVCLETLPAMNGDSVQALSFAFTTSGQYASSVAVLSAGVTGQYVRFRANAPLANPIGLRVIDDSGQTLQFHIDRSSSFVDDMGWSVHSTLVTSSITHWGGKSDGVLHEPIKSIALDVGSVSTSLRGNAYFRDLQILNDSPSISDAVLPPTNLSVKSFSYDAGTSGGTGGLQTLPPVESDALQVLSFDFSRGGQYVASIFTPGSPVDGNYIRFRVNAPLESGIGLRVVDETNQTLQFQVTRLASSIDDMGWSTQTVRVESSDAHWGGANDGVLHGNIQQIWFNVNKTSASVSGTAYFKNFEVLNHAPSQFYPVLAPMLAPIGSTKFSAYPSGANGPSGSLSVTPLENGDLLQNLTYAFTGAQQVVASDIFFSPATAGDTLSFLAKIPAGLSLLVYFHDSAGQSFQVPVIKPLGSLNETSWVQYSVSLLPTSASALAKATIKQPIKSISLVAASAPNSYNVAAVQPTGTISIEQIQLSYNQRFLLDLAASSATITSARVLGSNPLTGMGVNIHSYDVRAYDIAAGMGFGGVRYVLGWEGIETSKGIYNFPSYDDARVRALNARSLTPLMIAFGNNTLYAKSVSSALATPANQAAYAAFVGAAAAHFKGHDVSYELGNELNLPANWLPSPDPTQFSEMQKLASAAIRSADSHAPVFSGGLAFVDFSFLSSLIASSALANLPANLSAVAIHPYNSGDVEIEADSILAANRMLSASGLKAKVQITEIGSTSVSYNPIGTAPSALFQQAINVVRGVLMSWAADTPFYIYQLRDEIATPEPTVSEANFGLIDYAYQPKPAAKAFNLMVSAAKNRFYQGLVTGNPSTIQAMKFAASGQETTYVVWANTINNSGSFTFPNNCNPSLDFAGEPTGTANSCALDILGNPLTCAAVANSRMQCSVSTSGGPVFVRMAEAQ